MKGQFVYLPRPADERAAFEWWLDRRTPKWSVTLHTHRCDGDARDFELMLTVQRLRAIGFDVPVLTPSLLCLAWIDAGGDLA